MRGLRSIHRFGGAAALVALGAVAGASTGSAGAGAAESVEASAAVEAADADTTEVGGAGTDEGTALAAMPPDLSQIEKLTPEKMAELEQQSRDFERCLADHGVVLPKPDLSASGFVLDVDESMTAALEACSPGSIDLGDGNGVSFALATPVAGGVPS